MRYNFLLVLHIFQTRVNKKTLSLLMIKFSIVIPTYNRASFIANTIQSVLRQEYDNFEIIVVDDGSTDNTEEIVRSIKDSRLIYHKKENGERAKARNRGTQLATGNYVNFLDSDDALYPNHLSEAFKLINTHSSPEVFHLNYDILNDETKVLSKRAYIEGDLNTQLVKKGNLLSCNGVFIRKDIASENPFNEDRELSASEDYELWLRLASRYTIFYSNTITSTIINHDLRSVLNFNNEKLIKRLELFIHYITIDEKFIQQYAKYRGLLTAHSFTYVSLHIALTGKDKLTSLLFLFKALKTSPSVLSSKRFYSILFKNLTKF